MKDQLYAYPELREVVETFDIRPYNEYYRMDERFFYGRTKKGKWFSFHTYINDDGERVACWIEKWDRHVRADLEAKRIELQGPDRVIKKRKKKSTTRKKSGKRKTNL